MAKDIIIDSDCGIDDATAILVALRHPHTNVKAITVVAGNVPMKEGLECCRTLLSVTNKKDEVPIFPGADGPLIRSTTSKPTWPGHGRDGLGNYTESDEFQTLHLPGAKDVPIEKEVAANALVRMVNEKPGHYDIVALGPLTNIALAIMLDGSFLSKIKTLYVMGGCLFAKGNSNRAAEFNFHWCPESAHIVFHASHLFSSSSMAPPASPKVVLVTWETTIEHGFPWRFYDALTVGAPVTPLSRFLRSFTSTAESLSRAQHELTAATRDVLMRDPGPYPAGPRHQTTDGSEKRNGPDLKDVEVAEDGSSKDSHDGLPPMIEECWQAALTAGLFKSDCHLHPLSPNASSHHTALPANLDANGVAPPPRKKHAPVNHHDEHVRQCSSYVMCDLYAMSACLEPESVILEHKDWDVAIELHGEHTKGMVCVDWMGFKKQTPANARLVLGINVDAIAKLLWWTFKAEGAGDTKGVDKAMKALEHTS
ncbi:hypothetical protein HK102_013464 [Quaeritorhiza haematococci]|nr:hypothetical protein HK102_013464 [Quaeritorhiza haematococci]